VTILYNFGESSGQDGQGPASGLVRDPSGTFYGTTDFGGTTGNGTIFSLDPNGQETILHNFDGTGGRSPIADLARDSLGNLYGTTFQGGQQTEGGVAFKLDSTGAFTILHTFLGPEGYGAYGGVILDKSGNLYGTTVYGGDFGYGVVYKLTP
jgi:uncharacterized repeat protein (TIGR03803 family)